LLADGRLDVNAFTQTAKPVTALMIGAHINRPDLIRILLNYPGIDRNLKSQCRASAYHIACKHGFAECARLTARVETTPTPAMKMKPKRRATLMLRGSPKLQCNLHVLVP
jgi:ankyrin repeat protein